MDKRDVDKQAAEKADATGIKEKTQWSGMKTYHIVRGNLVEEKTTQFNDGDTYVVDNGSEIFVWLGKDSSVDEEFAGAYLAQQIDMSRRGAPKVTTVEQGKEPKNLLDLLGPSFKVVKGGVEGMLKHVPQLLILIQKALEREGLQIAW